MRLRLLSLLAGLALCGPLFVAGQDGDPHDPEAAGKEVAAPAVKQWQLDGYGGYFTVRGTTGGAKVTWDVEPRPKGFFVRQFPGAHAVAVGGPPGRYTLVATVTVFRGKVLRLPKDFKEGDEIPLEITADTRQARHAFELVGGGAGPVEPPPKKPPPDPVDPPPDPVDPPKTGLYFMVIRADGPASPEFVRVMSDPAWGTLRQRGHRVKDFTATDARRLGAPVPAALPAVVTLTVSADGRESVVARGPVPLPTTSDGILALEAVK